MAGTRIGALASGRGRVNAAPPLRCEEGYSLCAQAAAATARIAAAAATPIFIVVPARALGGAWCVPPRRRCTHQPAPFYAHHLPRPVQAPRHHIPIGLRDLCGGGPAGASTIRYQARSFRRRYWLGGEGVGDQRPQDVSRRNLAGRRTARSWSICRIRSDLNRVPAGGTCAGGDKLHQDILIPIYMPSRFQTEGVGTPDRTLFISKRDHGIDFRCPACWYVRTNQ